MSIPGAPDPEATAGPAADEDTTDEDTPDEDVSTPLKRVRGESVAAAVGSFMGGIEQQVFQRRPPAVELVQQNRPVRGTTGDGLEITLDIPDVPADGGHPQR